MPVELPTPACLGFRTSCSPSLVLQGLMLRSQSSSLSTVQVRSHFSSCLADPRCFEGFATLDHSCLRVPGLGFGPFAVDAPFLVIGTLVFGERLGNVGSRRRRGRIRRISRASTVISYPSSASHSPFLFAPAHYRV